MKPAASPRPFLIDTDTGVDDALALLYAMHSPEIKVEAVTTVAGNVEVEKCTRNAETVLGCSQGGYVPPVIQGARKPLRRPLVTAPEVHGKDGLGNTQRGKVPLRRSRGQEALETIRDLCEEFPHRLTIVAIGPLTNIALALQKYPRSLKKVKRIITMGGAFGVPGNTGPVAEFNYFVDPDAANIVLQSGLPLTIVPLDITHQIVLLRKQIRKVVRRRRSPLGSFVYRFTAPYMWYHKMTLGFNGGYLHDPLAVAIAVEPSLARLQKVRVEVECGSDLTRGMTVADFRKKGRTTDPDVVVSVDRKRFLSLFRQKVLAR